MAVEFIGPMLLPQFDRWRLVVVLNIGAACIVPGCGPSNGRLEIRGNVTLNGQPLDQGIISFNDASQKLPSAEATIDAGAFRMPAGKGLLPGKYLVAIDSADPKGPTARPDQYTMEIPMSRIPQKYNVDTVLSAEVDSTKNNEFVFELEAGN